LNCSFCSVTTFNGARYRDRPIADVVEEMRSIREKLVLVVDDNLIGTSTAHIARAKGSITHSSRGLGGGMAETAGHRDGRRVYEAGKGGRPPWDLPVFPCPSPIWSRSS